MSSAQRRTRVPHLSLIPSCTESCAGCGQTPPQTASTATLTTAMACELANAHAPYMQARAQTLSLVPRTLPFVRCGEHAARKCAYWLHHFVKRAACTHTDVCTALALPSV